MKTYISLLAAGVAGLLFACKKQVETPQPLTRTQLLVGHKWQLRQAIVSFPGTQDFDNYTLVSPCTRDDYWQFALPNNWTTDEGTTKCSSAYPQTQVGTWALSGDDTKLILTDQNFTTNYTILRLTGDSLKMSFVVPQLTGVNGLTKVVYTVMP